MLNSCSFVSVPKLYWLLLARFHSCPKKTCSPWPLDSLLVFRICWTRVLLSMCQPYLAYFSARFHNRWRIQLVIGSFKPWQQRLIHSDSFYIMCLIWHIWKWRSLCIFRNRNTIVRSVIFIWYCYCSYLFLLRHKCHSRWVPLYHMQKEATCY